MELTLESRVRMRSSIISQNLDEDAVMANIDTGFYFGVGKTGKRIWELVKSEISVHEVCSQLQQEYNVDLIRCESDVMTFMKELLQEDLLEIVA